MRLIDADALKEVLHGTMDWCDLIEVDKAIRDAPTIDPFKDKSLEQLMDECFNRGYRKAVKHGRWVEATREDPCYYVCSICGKMIDIEENYCPNCGAQMNGGTENED